MSHYLDTQFATRDPRLNVVDAYPLMQHLIAQ